ncbi:MAG: DUF4238 domain-containing protein [Alphaproteobacteria bacterium]|nr:DUF4238 domain-containing protein [Alphaproteobacteria bacterium]
MKHHYIPEFYTKRWATASDKLICQFALHPEGVSPKRKSPAGVGFEEDLYAIPGAPQSVSSHLEAHFFRVTDQEGSDALNMLLSGRLNDMTSEQKSGWARFIMSTLHRNPQKIRWYGKVWAGMHAEAAENARREIEENNGDLGQLGDFEHTFAVSFVRVLQTIMDSTLIGQHLINMRWMVIELHEYKRLLTSDRPLLRTNGIGNPDAQIGFPLSPSHLFVAANNDRALQQVASINAKDLSRQVNHHIVIQAERYVYAADDAQQSFVTNRLGKQPSQFLAPPHLLQKYPRD